MRSKLQEMNPVPLVRRLALHSQQAKREAYAIRRGGRIQMLNLCLSESWPKLIDCFMLLSGADQDSPKVIPRTLLSLAILKVDWNSNTGRSSSLYTVA